MPLQASALAVGSPGFQTTIQADRQFIRAALGDGPAVLQQGDFAITANPTSHSIDVAAGFAVLPGNNAQDQGSYFAWSESGETLPWPVPSASPRIDTLVMRVADPQYGTVTGATGGRFDLIQGVPAASPVARSDTEINTTFFVPGGWMRVGDVRVNVADTGAIPGGQVTKKAIHVNGDIVDYSNIDAGTLTSTTPSSILTDAGTTATTTFIAPASGQVMLTIGATAHVTVSGGGNGYCFIRPYIQGGAFSSMTDLGENYQLISRFPSTGIWHGGYTEKRKKLTGLTPGTTYTIQLWYWLNASGPTMSIDDRSIVIEPIALR